MKEIMIAVLMAVSAGPSMSCELSWHYADSSYIDGFRVYQNNVLTANLPPELRNATCDEASITQSLSDGPITMTAYLGETESPHSEPAEYAITVPGTIKINIGL